MWLLFSSVEETFIFAQGFDLQLQQYHFCAYDEAAHLSGDMQYVGEENPLVMAGHISQGSLDKESWQHEYK